MFNIDVYKHGFDIPLSELIKGTPGITSAFGQGLAEAASVCLEDQGHASPTNMTIDGDISTTASVSWDSTTDQMHRCWNDTEVATEHGAYGVASLLISKVSDLQVIERSKKGTGFDYWLGTKDDEGPLFQGRARLEVSGIRKGTKTEVSQRERQKIKQTEKSGRTLPAVVIVVEFGTPLSKVISKWKK